MMALHNHYLFNRLGKTELDFLVKVMDIKEGKNGDCFITQGAKGKCYLCSPKIYIYSFS